VARARGALETFAKPLTLLLLIGWYAVRLLPDPSPAGVAFLVGLITALFGDVLLLRPRRRLAVGMAAFVVTQLGYTAALNARGMPTGLAPPVLALAVAAIAVLGFLLISRRARWHRRPWLRPATVVYAGALALMLWSALLSPLRPGWSGPGGWLVLVGGVLFASSDALLGWVEFVRPSRRKLVVVMVTYHLGQLALTWGFAQST
jgi:uncharacterized membrane protein YhhN